MPATAGSDPIVKDFANVPNTGAQISEHESIVQGPPVNGQPTTKIVTEVTESDPAAPPVDTKTKTVSQTIGAKPAIVAADPAGGGGGAGLPPPANTAANVPGAGKPGKAAKPVFDTNHPKVIPPVTTNNNVPNAPGGAPAPAAAPGGAAGLPPPAMVEADTGSSSAPGGAAGPPPGAAGAPAGAAPAPANMATPAPAGKVGGLWWEPHLPTQARPNTPA